MSSPYQRLGRLLGIDMGEKRIGLALSDPTQTLAQAHSILQRTSRTADFAAIQTIVQEQTVVGLVIGLPQQPDRPDDAKIAWIQDYGHELSQTLQLPLTFWDEAFTTRQAANSLRARGRKAKQQKDRLDAVAAAFILQDYLDAQAPTPPLPEDFPYETY
ncbi:MAG TPA: Holliday junction resolvase RuvX [Anaerolineae bacterium]|nr:Holliday junction resolvase RuvX [Anaerolineae bacterium]